MASVQLDFYRAKAGRLAELEATEKLSSEEMTECSSLEAILEYVEDVPNTVLGRIEYAFHEKADMTGDPVIDEWNAMLDAGVVPDEFWGEYEPPFD